MKASVYWHDNSCILQHPKAAKLANKFATYEQKDQQPDPDKPWIRRSVKTKVRIWQPVCEGDDTQVAFPQGLVDNCVLTLHKEGIEYTLIDCRAPFPEPRLDLLEGLRFRQKEKLIEMLLKRRSGLGSFPTRWGKSRLIINALRAFPGVKTVVTMPGADLLKQSVDDYRRLMPDREITGLFTGCPKAHRRESDDITIASMDSLHLCNPESTRLVVVDEPHAAGADTRSVKLAQFKNARILGFGATMSGRSDGSDLVFQGLIGPVISEVTYREAVAHKELCPIKAYIVEIPVRPKSYARLDQANAAYIYNNKVFARIVADIASFMLPPEWQAMVFVDREDQVTVLKEFLPGYPVAMAKLLTTKARAEMFDKARSGELNRVIASSIYSQGVTFSNLRALVNACGGGGSITGVQKPGRLAELIEGKKYGYLVDFRFIPVGNLPGADAVGTRQFFALSQARINKYINTGYEVVNVPLIRMGDSLLPDPKLMVFE